MLFKFLTGKEIGHLQTGLILSQVGGIIMIFMGLMVLWPSRLMIFDDIGGFVWIILGLGIIIIDIFLGFILLPFAISSLLIAILIFSDQNLFLGDFVFFETWRDIFLYYAVLLLVSLGVLRLFAKQGKKGKVDINDY